MSPAIPSAPLSGATRLSANFVLAEARCRCGQCRNERSPAIFREVQRLAPVLQRMRDYFGKPVHILSWVRCEAHNRACGGAKESHHKLGHAADVFIPGVPVPVIEEWCMRQPEVGGCHGYRGQGFVHLDLRPRIGGRVTTWEG